MSNTAWAWLTLVVGAVTLVIAVISLLMRWMEEAVFGFFIAAMLFAAVLMYHAAGVSL